MDRRTGFRVSAGENAYTFLWNPGNEMMRKSKVSITKLLLGFCVLFTAVALGSGGISTQTAAVVIENLKVGHTCSLKALANYQLRINSTCDSPVSLRMDVLLPDSSELKKNAAIIPDPSWVQLIPACFELEPQGAAVADIVITIPDDDQYLGRKFQVMVWSHPVGSSFIHLGLKSRIIFTLDSARADLSEMVSSADAGLDFDIEPAVISLEGVKLGTTWNLEQESGTVLRITNRGEQQRTITLQSLAVENSAASLTEGFLDTPDPTFLRFSQSQLTIGAGETELVRMSLDIPSLPEYKNKRYMFIIYAYSEAGGVTSGVYSRLYVSTT